MKTTALRDISEAIESLEKIIRRGRYATWKKNSEPDPESIDLSFSPDAPMPILEKMATGACSLCERRISYKPDQFKNIAPKIPYLILLHNPFHMYPDRFMHDPEHNAVFLKIIKGVLGFNASDFIVRDVLRCHFGKEDQKNPLWFQNCSEHIQKDLEQFSIKGILVMGEAVRFIEPNTELLQKKLGNVSTLFSVPAVFTAGPSRLVYMRKKNFPKTEIDQERRKIFEAVKLFKEKIMNR